MKKTGIVILTLMILSMAVPIVYAPESVSYEHYQAQFQWRSTSPQPTGAWSALYQNNLVESEYTRTGKVLHTEWTYQPYVEDEQSSQTVYVYDKKTGYWIEKAGQVSYVYTPLYGDYVVVNFFTGAVEIENGDLVHGVAYQYIYIYSTEDDTGVTDILPYAQWDAKVGAWLVGYSIYLWDHDTQAYAFDFPELICPLPMSEYDPIGFMSLS